MRVLRLFHSGVMTAWRARERELRRLGHDVRLLSARRWDEGGAVVTLRADPREADGDVVPVATVCQHPAGYGQAHGAGGEPPPARGKGWLVAVGVGHLVGHDGPDSWATRETARGSTRQALIICSTSLVVTRARAGSCSVSSVNDRRGHSASVQA